MTLYSGTNRCRNKKQSVALATTLGRVCVGQRSDLISIQAGNTATDGGK